jgi:hypothetical protein
MVRAGISALLHHSILRVNHVFQKKSRNRLAYLGANDPVKGRVGIDDGLKEDVQPGVNVILASGNEDVFASIRSNWAHRHNTNNLFRTGFHAGTQFGSDWFLPGN